MANIAYGPTMRCIILKKTKVDILASKPMFNSLLNVTLLRLSFLSLLILSLFFFLILHSNVVVSALHTVTGENRVFIARTVVVAAGALETGVNNFFFPFSFVLLSGHGRK